MTKAHDTKQQPVRPVPPPIAPWSRGACFAASVLIVLHLTAIISAPWAYPPPSSQLARDVARFFEPYQLATFSRHGYRFFAPNPGPSYIVRYEIDQSDGNVVAGRFPDAEKIWPRLLYHRFLILAEVTSNVESSIRPPNPPGGAPVEPSTALIELNEEMESARALAESLRKSLARQLLARYGGERVRLYVDRHLIATPESILQGDKLTDSQYYEELDMIADYSKSDL